MPDQNEQSRLMEKYPLVPVAALFCFGLILRFATVGQDPLWTDEAIAMDFAGASWDDLVMGLLYDASPPGSYLLFKQWSRFTVAPFEVRYLSALVGALTIPVTFLIGRKLFDARVGLFAALLLAINPYHFYYSQEIRYPALFTLFCALQIWAFIRLVQRKDWASTFFFILFTVIAGWIQYFVYFLLLAELVWIVINQKEWAGGFLKIFFTLWAIFFAVLPTYVFLIPQLIAGKPDRVMVPVYKAIYFALAFFVAGGSESHLPSLNILAGLHPIDDGMIYIAALSLLIAPYIVFFILGAVVQWKRGKGKSTALFLFLFTLLLFISVSRFMPIFRPKYLLPLMPLYVIIIAAGVFSRGLKHARVRGALGFAILTLVSSGFLVNQHFDPLCKRTAWHKVARIIEKYEKKGDAILIPNQYHSLGFSFEYRGNLEIISYTGDTPYPLKTRSNILLNKLNILEKRYSRFWIIEHKLPIFDPERDMMNLAEKKWIKILEEKGPTPIIDVPLSLFAKND